jgi:hypothetical protein
MHLKFRDFAAAARFEKIKMVHGFLKFHFCLTVPHYRTWKSLAEVESSRISENPEDRKDHFYSFKII